MTNKELLDEINKLKADLAKLSQKLDNKQGRVAARVSDLENKIKKYKNQIADLDSANDNKKERIAGLERKLDTKQGRMGDRVRALEGVVADQADEIAEHADDGDGHVGLIQSKVFLMKGSINRVNNSWRRLSFDGNYAMEMEDWTFTSASGHKGLRPSVTGFYDIDLSMGLEASPSNTMIVSQSIRVYKMSVATDQIIGILAKTINTASIRGNDAPTLAVSVKNVYLEDDEFILVVAKTDDGEANQFRFIDGSPETTHLSLELKYAHVLEGLEIQEPEVELPEILSVDFTRSDSVSAMSSLPVVVESTEPTTTNNEFSELSGNYIIAPNTHQGVAYWKHEDGHYIHFSGEKDTWVLTSPSDASESWVVSTMTPVQDAPSWPWTGSWVTENAEGELLDLPVVAYGGKLPSTPTPTPTTGTFYEKTPTPTTGTFYEKTPTPTTGSFYEKTPTSYEEAIDKLNEQQLQWNSLNITEYKFEFVWNCFCSAEYTTPVILHVRDNEIIDVEWANASENDAELVNPNVENYHTMSELFSFTSDYYTKKPHTMDVKFDDDHQFVAEMYADVQENIADEEMGFVASNLQVIV